MKRKKNLLRMIIVNCFPGKRHCILVRSTFALYRVWKVGSWGPFLESPVNFSGPKSNIQIEIKRIRARVLASKLLHFVSLTDSFIMLDAKLLKPRSSMETETAYRAR